MAVFLIMNETDANGSFLRETVVNADSIIRVDHVEPDLCCLRLQFFPLAPLYVSTSPEQIQITLNCSCS